MERDQIDLALLRQPNGPATYRENASRNQHFRLTSRHHKISITLSTFATMVRGIEGNEMSTPKASSQKKQPPSGSQSTKNQKSILGFFQKRPTNTPSPGSSTATPAKKTPISVLSKRSFTRPGLTSALTPQPSSDAPEPSSPIKEEPDSSLGRNKENGLSSSTTPQDAETNQVLLEIADFAFSSPSRKV
jgi:DNA mismatch repair protein MSH6